GYAFLLPFRAGVKYGARGHTRRARRKTGMHSKSGGVVVLVGVIAATVVLLAHAGVAPGAIMLSGDSNIANGLDGSGFAPGIDPGNQRFFKNILGSGHVVKIHNELDSVYGFPAGPALYGAINNYYNGLPGVTSSLFSGTITAATLSGIDVFFELSPNRSL